MPLTLLRFNPRSTGTHLLVLLPIFALVGGKAINETLVPGPYEWMGLARICKELFERPGFWCIAFSIWAIGIANANDGISWAQLFRQRHFALAWGAVAALLAGTSILWTVTEIAGTLVDFSAFTLLLSGMIVVDIIRAQGWQVGILRIGKSGIAGLAIFFGYTAIGYFHTMIKGTLFILASPEDALLWSIDDLLLGQHYYQHLAIWRLENSYFIQWLDIIYIGLLQQICWSAFFFHSAHDLANARRYLLAMFLIYTFGPLVYFLAPSMGPIFFNPDVFTDLKSAAPDTWHLSQFLLSQTNATIVGTDHPIAPFGYIAALPSLHVGIALVMTLAMAKSKLATAFNAALLTLTIVATNMLGWHYVSDILAGLLLGFLSWKVANLLFFHDK